MDIKVKALVEIFEELRVQLDALPPDIRAKICTDFRGGIYEECAQLCELEALYWDTRSVEADDFDDMKLFRAGASAARTCAHRIRREVKPL